MLNICLNDSLGMIYWRATCPFSDYSKSKSDTSCHDPGVYIQTCVHSRLLPPSCSTSSAASCGMQICHFCNTAIGIMFKLLFQISPCRHMFITFYLGTFLHKIMLLFFNPHLVDLYIPILLILHSEGINCEPKMKCEPTLLN